MVVNQDTTLKHEVLELARKYDYDEKHARFVEATALLIFDTLKNICGMGLADRTLLSHSALLHDIGNFLNKKKHHKYSKYIVSNDEIMDGCPKKERYLISLIVFNHRKKLHKDTFFLPKKLRDMVLKLSAILRVADALDYDRTEVSLRNIEIHDDTLEIAMEGVLPEKILNNLLKKKALFMEIFNMDIVLA